MNLPIAQPMLFVALSQCLGRALFILCPVFGMLPLSIVRGQTSTAAPPAAPSQIESRTLKLGEPIERELVGAQSHSYQITLAAGQYLHVVAEQRGIDVVVTLIGPDNKQLTNVDGDFRKEGEEIIEQVAEMAGSYQLSVKTTQKEVPAGKYKIRVAELRAATEQDRILQKARQLIKEEDRLYSAGKYDEARPLAEQALQIREEILGPEHALVAHPLNALGLIYWKKGDYVKAESLYQRALVIREKALGMEHPDFAFALGNLALLYWSKGEYAKAEPLYQRALPILERALGAEHSEVMKNLGNFALIYAVQGDYAKAEPLFQRALTIREKVLGAEHPDLPGALNNLATLYQKKADYAKAEPLYQRALAIWEKALGAEHPHIAFPLNNLADLYFLKGDYTKAELLYQRALVIREKALGVEHPDVVMSLNNLANLYAIQGSHMKAQPLYQRALAIAEKVLGAEHPDVSRPLMNLATSYYSNGNSAKAEPLYQRALVIAEKAFGSESEEVSDILDGLATIYYSQGDYMKAEPFYQSALAINEKALGLEHPGVAESFNNLAMLYEAKGEITQAITFQSRASAVSERNIALNLAIGSERQKSAYLAIFSNESNRIVSLHTRSAPNNSAACSLALTMILQRKGRTLDAMADSFVTMRRHAKPDDQELLDQLQETNSRLARLVLNGPQRITPAEHQARIKNLEEQKEKLETDISRRSAEFRAQATPVTIAAVQAAIPAQATLVEFASYRPFNPKYQKASEQFGAPRYVAYVLPPSGEAKWVELGEAKAIDEAVEKLRQALRDKRRKDVKQLARAVDEIVMRPVRTLLGQTRRVFISPDGALNLIPFAALVDERNRYLVRRYDFSYLTSGRDLLRLQVKQPNKQTAMVMANPDFGDEANAGTARQRGLVYRPGTKAATGEGAVLAGYYFPPLQGTASEARSLKAMLTDATVLTQGQATESALKQVSGPRILHIATHGFFLAPPQAAQAEDRGLRPVSLSEPQVAGPIENPLLRSGLALAGANLSKSDEGDDGILTAQEAAGLDLWGTKLVVLSACDTGVGEVKNGEGVYGLRRALVLAGTETQVMSLWPVSDKGTRDLMIEYYRRLLRGEERSAALRQVQLRMLASQGRGEKGPSRLFVTKGLPETTTKDKRTARDYSHPYYWASFIQSGEWRKLD